MKSKVLLITAVLLAFGFSLVNAGNFNRVGTSGAHELQIPIGARGAALGGAAMANTFGVEAIAWNPAGLAMTENTEVMFTHLSYLADINVNFVGVATNIEDFGVLGVSAKIVSIGDIEETTEIEPDGTGRVYSPSMAVLGVSYARTLNANVSFGASAKFINERVFEVNASGFAVDVGFLYDPRWNGLMFGFSINNYGGEMSFAGDGFKDVLGDRTGSSESAPFDLPSSINMGVAYNLYDQGSSVATFTGNYRANNYYQDLFQGGLEYIFDGKYSARLGYNYADAPEWLYGFSAGAGLVLPISGMDLTVDYTWSETETFDALQFITLKGMF